MRQNEQRLVEAFQRGDRDAFTELVGRYQNYLATVAYSATGDFARSEDLTQQAFLTAWQNQTELRDPNRWAAWLRGILRNLLRNENRKQSRERERREDLARSRSMSPVMEPAEHCLRKEQSELLWSILGGIPEPYRETLALYYREGHSVSTVAAQMELSEDAVKQRLARGRQMIKAEIESFVDESLQATRPGNRLTASIVAALPAAGSGFSPSAVAGKSAAASLGGATLGKWLLIGAGPLIGIAGAVIGSRASLRSATSAQERQFLWRAIVGIWVLTGIFVLLHLGVAFAWRPLYQNWIFQAVGWTGYFAILAVSIQLLNQRLAEIKQQWGTPDERQSVRQAMQKPVSVAGLRWNLIGATLGSTVFLPIVAALSRDWSFLAIAIVLQAGVVYAVWVTAPRFQTVPDQIRFNGLAMMLTILPTSLLVLMRWDHWSLATGIQPELPGWLVAAGMLLFAALLYGLLEWKARRIESLPPGNSN